MKNEFKKVSKVRLSDQIVEQIRALIRNGTINVGEQLPSERDLAAQLMVSRLPLREALKALEATHVIESRAGDGYYVCGLATDSMVQLFRGNAEEDKILLRELQEARIAIEVSAIQYICQRITAEDIALLEEAIAEMAVSLEKGIKNDIIIDSMNFHKRLVDAAHNKIMSAMLECVASSLYAGRVRTSEARYRRANEEHREILNALLEHNAEEAERLLTEHLRTAYND